MGDFPLPGDSAGPASATLHRQDARARAELKLPDQPVSLGPFRIEAPIGRGAVGDVYRARHETTGLAVALKLLRTELAGDDAHLAAFRDEVHAMAGLDHPGIVAVYEIGLVTMAQSEASNGWMAPGTPWLAMELVRGSPLHNHVGRLPFTAIRDVLLEVLDALAHAHARGLVHRDVKPPNVVLEAASGRAKLMDFGVAHAIGGANYLDKAQIAVGTPGYMAPEQVLEGAEACGPWTDLYALGCLGWALASGSPPFGENRDLSDLLSDHCHRDPPPLKAHTPLPTGYEPWLRRLLAKKPRERFRFAADAAEELRDMAALSTTIRVLGPGGRASGLEAVPPAWRREATMLTPQQLMVVGLSLFGTRRLPIIGRHDEQKALWDQLLHSAEGKRNLMCIGGPAGSGKSRLADWLCEQASESGIAVTMKAEHSELPGPEDGLVAMIQRHLRIDGLSRSDAIRRLDQELVDVGADSPEERRSIIEVLVPEQDLDDNPRQREGERFEALHRALRHFRDDRCVLLLLDDVQWGPEALRFARFVMERRRGRPRIFVVLTMRNEAMAERAEERALLQQILKMEGASSCSLSKIPSDELARMGREYLGLSDSLAVELSMRSGGNPLFATQMVAFWLQRQILQPGPGGFKLQPGASRELPPDLAALWDDQVARLLRGRSEQELRALEAAAVIGAQVDERLWRELCMEAGIGDPGSLVEEMLRRGLAVRRKGKLNRWNFVHGLLAERLRARAAEEGRLAGYHALCAHLLERRSDAETHAVRIGRHLLAAGDYGRAAERLMTGAKQRYARRPGETPRLLRLADEAAQRANLPGSHRLWATSMLLHCRCLRDAGRIEESLELARRTVGEARIHGWGEALCHALLHQASALARMGKVNDALEQSLEGEHIAELMGIPGLRARAYLHTGFYFMEIGQGADADKRFRTAAALPRDPSMAHNVGGCLRGLAVLSRGRGRLDEAERWLREATELYEDSGVRRGHANILNEWGDLAMTKGDLDHAETLLRRSAELYRLLGGGDVVFPMLNLGHLEVLRGNFAEARRMLDEAMAVGLRARRPRAVVACRVLRQHCFAAVGDWTRWDEALRETEEALLATGLCNPEILAALHDVGTRALQLGHADRARTAWELGLRAAGNSSEAVLRHKFEMALGRAA